MIKGDKMKIRKARKIKRKYEITSIDKIPIIKLKVKQKKFQLKAQRNLKIWKTKKIL